MKKMLMLATTAAMIEQFNKNNILILEDMGYEVHVAGNWKQGNPISEERLEIFKKWIAEHHGKWFQISATRKPTDLKNNIKAYRDVIRLINKYKYEFIHCHTPIGSMIGRIAAKRTKTKIIYTAHGFHFFKGAPIKNWLLYFPAEWICSWMTDVLITINTEDYGHAKKYLHAKRTEYIPGVGVDVEKFADCYVNKKEKCKELGISTDDFVIISVGELNSNKNHEIIIKAMADLKNPNIKYLICGQGELAEYLSQKIGQHRLDNQIMLLGYRTDVKELLKISDVFAFPSRREGLGLAALEAMAAGLPLITSDIHGIKDYTKNNISGCCINPDSETEMAMAITKMFLEVKFREKCGINNIRTVKEYSMENTDKIMKSIYKNYLFGDMTHIYTE